MAYLLCDSGNGYPLLLIFNLFSTIINGSYMEMGIVIKNYMDQQ